MIKFQIGQKVSVIGTVSAFDTALNKICFEGLRVDEGEFHKDHAWVTYSDRLKVVGLVIGETITFTATIREYIGIDSKERQVTKIGIEKLRNIQRIK